MFNHRSTIFYVVGRFIARIDLGGKSNPRVERFLFAESTEDLVFDIKVRKCFNLGPKTKNRTWFVTDEIWSGLVSLPPDVVGIADSDELDQCFALEAESFSGISAMESRIGSSPIPSDSGEQRWWVTQIAEDHFASIQNAGKQRSIQVHGIAHPSLTIPISNQSIPPHHSEEDLRSWACDFIRCFANRDASPPTISIGAPSRRFSRRVLVTPCVSLLALIGCGVSHWNGTTQLTSINAMVANLELKQQELERLSSGIKLQRKSLETLKQELSKADLAFQSDQSALASVVMLRESERNRWIVLMDALVMTSSEANWIRRIEVIAGTTILHGLSIDDASIHQLASALEKETSQKGWIVQPAQTKSIENRMVDFTMALRPVAIDPSIEKQGSNASRSVQQHPVHAPKTLEKESFQ